MTHTSTHQSEALIFANDRPTSLDDDLYQWSIDAEDLIRRQHARIEELESQLSAIGAGGVVPQWDGKINPADFNVETFRRSGKNGWIAKPDNYCVRITHVHTGLFEEGVSERSIHTNKAEAWERLSARLEAIAAAHPAEGVPSQTVPVGYVALAALTSRTHADDYAKCFATETALLENYPAAKVIAVFDHATSQPAAQGMDAQTIKHISALSELVRMPNAEHFADAHNAAVRHLRALAAKAKQGGAA